MKEFKTRLLKCELTEEEVLEKGQQLARAEEERDQNATEKKAVVSQYKQKDDALASTISQLTTQINTQSEYRQVEIEDMPNYETRMMETYRKDTGERIATQAMTAEELQQAFDFARKDESDEEPEQAKAADGSAD